MITEYKIVDAGGGLYRVRVRVNPYGERERARWTVWKRKFETYQEAQDAVIRAKEIA